MRAVLAQNRWWAARVAVLPVHMAFYAVLVFFLVRLIPGDPVYTIAGGQGITADQYAKAQAALGLSGSTGVQLLHYLHNLVSLDLGSSLTNGTPVLEQIGQRLPATVEIAVLALAGSVVLTLVAGYVIVFNGRSLVARALRSYARAAGAVPDFVLGVGGIFVFYAVLHVLPAPLGLYDPLLNAPPRATSFPVLDAALSGDTILLRSMASHLLLPEVVLVLAYAPLLLKLFVRALDEAVDAAPTRFRIATGASRTTVLLSIARRASPSTVAMAGTLFGYLLGGAVVVEQLFGMPGMGTFGVEAVNASDLVSLQGFLLVVAALSLVVFLAVDITTMLLDPRRRPGTGDAS